ncbi:MAG: HAD family phosphatase [Thermoflexales bacterium]|nr:HAD family phosphatase [Thermoflexales bacterium]
MIKLSFLEAWSFQEGRDALKVGTKLVTTKAIFWDNDGVLVDTERLFFRATRETMAPIGVSLTQEQYVEAVLKSGRGVWHLAAEKGIPPAEIDRLREERDALYSQLLRDESSVIAGVEETLIKLHGKFLMGIVTSSRRDHFELIHRSSGLLDYFDFVLTSQNYTRFKPDPEPYLLALKKSGFDAGECVVVEDSQRGLIAARQAGIRCFVVPTELTEGSDFSGAYRVLHSVKELATELLEKRGLA